MARIPTVTNGMSPGYNDKGSAPSLRQGQIAYLFKNKALGIWSNVLLSGILLLFLWFHLSGQHIALLIWIGLIITLSIYGVIVAWAGQIFGLAKVSKWMFLVAGTAALLFGLGVVWFSFPSIHAGFEDMARAIEEKFARAGVEL